MSARHATNSKARIAAAAAMAAAWLSLSGCVTSQSSRYRSTVTQSVQPEQTANADVAGAFGLRHADAPAAGLAAVDP